MYPQQPKKAYMYYIISNYSDIFPMKCGKESRFFVAFMTILNLMTRK